MTGLPPPDLHHQWQVLPSARAVLWNPLVQGTVRRTPGGTYPVFIDHKAMIALHEHFRAAKEQAVFGFLTGDLFQCPNSRVHYAVIDSTIRLNQPIYGDKTAVVVERLWARIQQELQKIDARLIGWYHSHPGLPLGLGPSDVETQQTHFVEPWHTAMVLGATTAGPVAGLFRQSASPGWPQTPMPFYELLPQGPELAAGKKVSALPWKNFVTDDPATGAAAAPSAAKTGQTRRAAAPPAPPADAPTAPRPAVTAPPKVAPPPAPAPPRPAPPPPPPPPVVRAEPTKGAKTPSLHDLPMLHVEHNEPPAPAPPPPAPRTARPQAPTFTPSAGSAPAPPPARTTPAPPVRPSAPVRPPQRRRSGSVPKFQVEVPAGRGGSRVGRVVLVLLLLGVLGGVGYWYQILRPRGVPFPLVARISALLNRKPGPAASPAPDAAALRRDSVARAESIARANAPPRVDTAAMRRAAAAAAAESLATAMRVFDQLNDSVTIAVGNYGERAQLFAGKQIACGGLSAGLIAIEDLWKAYNIQRRKVKTLDPARITRDRATSAGVDSVEAQFDHSGCARP